MSRARRNAKADEYFRRAPNYSAEAIPCLLWNGSKHGLEGRVVSESWLKLIADGLMSSHKFALPNGGFLFDRTSESMARGWRLPYRSCAFEFSNPGPHLLSDTRTGQESKPVDATILLAMEHDGVTAIFTINRWEGWWGASYWFPLLSDSDTKIVPKKDIPPGQVIAGPSPHALLRADDVDWTEPYAIVGLKFGHIGEMAEEFIEKHGLSDEEIHARAAALSINAIEVVTQACAALSCTNVTTELIRPNREARAARPESTLFDYHVLMIRPGAERHESSPLGGSHASPRTHLRRGHIRQHPTAGRIWVNSCVVNPTAIGTVNKDYRIV